MKCITVFNNKGGVGKTSLVYHLAWMYDELDYNVLVADLDPQANLTSMFLDDDELGGALDRGWSGRDHLQCAPAAARRDRRRHHAARGGTADRHRTRCRRHAAVRRRGRALQPVAGLPRRETSRIPCALGTVARHANGSGCNRGRPHPRGRRPEPGRTESSRAGDGRTTSSCPWRPISTPFRDSAISGRRCAAGGGSGRNECNATLWLASTCPAAK